jgi:hypothetical protein
MSPGANPERKAREERGLRDTPVPPPFLWFHMTKREGPMSSGANPDKRSGKGGDLCCRRRIQREGRKDGFAVAEAVAEPERKWRPVFVGGKGKAGL